MKIITPCLFGLEGLLADELRGLSALNVCVENGRVLFEGDENILARVNIFSRYAERVLILLGQFSAITFTELFDGVKRLQIEDYIGRDDAFPVKGWSINSALHSIPDCQSIIKKALVERLSLKYGIKWFSETGPKYQIQFSILKDEVSIMLDTSGEGLHKRGYRAKSTTAPIKETLAAAMAYVAHVYPDSTLYDPFCGSGTILIESALLVNKIAPGLKRSFAAERYAFMSKKAWQTERMHANDSIIRTKDLKLIGYDIDETALRLCEHNAKLAGVGGSLQLVNQDINKFEIKEERALVITNPPYGERLLEVKDAEKLYKIMGERFITKKGLRYYIISPHDDFEKIYGTTARKRRKLYNGMIKCQMYMYF